MKRHTEHMGRAIKQIRIADHMLTQTYPRIQEEKLLLAIADNLHKGFEACMKAALDYERAHQRAPAYHDEYGAIVDAFERYCAKAYKVGATTVTSLRKIAQIIEGHKKSPVEFARKGSFVICSDTYEMEQITPAKLSEYITHAKQLVTTLEGKFS